MTELYVRPAAAKDLDRIMEIYAAARETMRKNGNPNQWGTDHPPRGMISEDIRIGRSYAVCSRQNGREQISGVFVLIIGEDPTYKVIEDGEWLNDEPYGTIHRIAGDGSAKGVLEAALVFAAGRIRNIRIDTHHDNTIMQHLLDKYGFTRCGIIYVADGTPRIAYHRRCSI